MTFEIILNNKDILYKITDYLSFENKILFGKCCKINFLKYYNFNSKDYQFKDLHDLFEDDCDYIGDFRYNLKDCICNELLFNKYLEYNKKTYIENNLEEFYSSGDESDIDTDEFVDKICNLPIDKFKRKIEYYNDPYYGRHSLFSNIFEEDLDNILEYSMYIIYIRILIEIIEDYNLDIKYDNKMNICDDLDDILPISIIDKMRNYYILSFENDNINTDVICTRCGLFGHDNVSKTCIFYDKKFEKREIKKEVKYIIDAILDKVKNINEEKKRIKKRELTMCKGNNCSGSKSNKCIFNRCKNCCKDLECLYHINQQNKEIENKQKKINKKKL